MAKYHHFAKLLSRNRRKMGYTTSRKFHGSMRCPPIEYQSWNHAEAGRRLPRPETALSMASILNVPQVVAMLAYMRDLFPDTDSQEIIDNFKDYLAYKQLPDSKQDHASGGSWHSLTEPQWRAIEKDTELFRLISIPFQHDRIHIQDLSNRLQWPIPKVMNKVQALVHLKLLEFHKEFAIKIYQDVKIPIFPKTLHLRKALLIQNINEGLGKETTYKNWTINLSEDGKQDLLKALKLIDAKCHLNHEESKKSDVTKTYNVINYFNPL